MSSLNPAYSAAQIQKLRKKSLTNLKAATTPVLNVLDNVDSRSSFTRNDTEEVEMEVPQEQQESRGTALPEAELSPVVLPGQPLMDRGNEGITAPGRRRSVKFQEEVSPDSNSHEGSIAKITIESPVLPVGEFTDSLLNVIADDNAMPNIPLANSLVAFLVEKARMHNITHPVEFLDFIDDKCPFVKKYFVDHMEVVHACFGFAKDKSNVVPHIGIQNLPNPMHVVPSFQQPPVPSEAPSHLISHMSNLSVCKRSDLDSHSVKKQCLASKLHKKIQHFGSESFASQSIAMGESAWDFGSFAQVYSTPDQDEKEASVHSWWYWRAAQISFLLLIHFYNYTFVCIRMMAGSEVLPPGLEIFEIILDVFNIALNGLNFIQPIEIDGQWVTDKSTITSHYLKGEFVFDILTVFPLQIFLLPMVSHDVLPTMVRDFVRVNRLLCCVKFSFIYDYFADTYISHIHPTFMRIVKFCIIIYFYTMITAAPVGVVIRVDYENGKEWMNLIDDDSTYNYLKIVAMCLELASGRNFEFPVSDAQIAVMLFLSAISLGSTAVIIAGVTSMVISMVERSSKLANKLDEVMQELGYMRISDSLIEEISSYYTRMFQIFNTFDYKTGDDFFDDLPPELQQAIHDEIAVQMIQSLPLFQDVLDDTEFVRQMAAKLVMYVLIPDTIIVKHGEEGDDMFFINKGEAAVILPDGRQVALLGEGTFFGEQALLFGGRRTATIKAQTMCQVYALSRSDFEEMIDIRPDALEKILSVTIARRKANAKDAEALRQQLKVKAHLRRQSTSAVLDKQDSKILREETLSAIPVCEETSSAIFANCESANTFSSTYNRTNPLEVQALQEQHGAAAYLNTMNIPSVRTQGSSSAEPSPDNEKEAEVSGPLSNDSSPNRRTTLAPQLGS